MNHLLYAFLDLFYVVGAMSLKGLFAATAVVLILFFLWRTRASKTVLLLLWAVVAFRLVCPWAPASPLSLYNLHGVDDAILSELDDLGDHSTYSSPTGHVHYEEEGTDAFDRAVEAGGRPVVNEVTGRQEVAYTEDSDGRIIPLLSLTDRWGMILAPMWLTGVLSLLIYSGLSYLRLKKRLCFAVKDDTLPNIWYSDRISSPCVVGFLRPRVYLTFGMSEQEMTYVLAHEQQHIKNQDHIWKVLAWLIMCIHWFNPLLWLFYRSFLLTVEDACDQRVLRQLGEEQKADYSQALLALSTGRRFRPGPSPIAFDEGDTKNRVKTILKYKKPILWVTVIAVVIAAVVGVCVFTGPEKQEKLPVGTDTALADKKLLNTVVYCDFAAEVGSLEELGFPFAFDLEYDRLEASCEGGSLHYLSGGAHTEPSEELICHSDPPGTIHWWHYDPTGLEKAGYQSSLSFTLYSGDEKVLSGILYIRPSGEASYSARATLSDDRYTFVQNPDQAGGLIRLKMDSPGTADDPATPTATLAPVESAPANPDGDGSSDLEDLALTWVIPVGTEDPMTYGFPLTFSFPFDYFDASVTGTPYATDKKTILSGHPIQGATGRTLFWWPYQEGNNVPLEAGGITASVYQDGEKILACSLLFILMEETDDTLTYSVQITLHGYDNYVWLENPQGSGGGAIRLADSALPETLTTWSVDLTHDGVNETVSIVCDYYAQVYYVNVYASSGRKLWYGEAAIYHAGQNGIYLYEEDGKHYLMQWVNYGQSGMGSIIYTVFSLTEHGEPIVYLEDQFDMEMDDPLSVDLDEFWRINEESIRLLSHSIVLVSSNFDTPNGEYYSTPDHILTPILRENYLMWWTPEELESIQAKIQGTYTFRGEVVNIFEDSGSILVEDHSLWVSKNGYGYYFMIPVDDLAQFREGDKVQVTADGPLYRRKLPDEGTSVTVEPIT